MGVKRFKLGVVKGNLPSTPNCFIHSFIPSLIHSAPQLSAPAEPPWGFPGCPAPMTGHNASAGSHREPGTSVSRVFWSWDRLPLTLGSRGWTLCCLWTKSQEGYLARLGSAQPPVMWGAGRGAAHGSQQSISWLPQGCQANNLAQLRNRDPVSGPAKTGYLNK